MEATNKPSESAEAGDKANTANRQISFLAVNDLVPAPHNPRKHSRTQVRAIAKSIEAFGFNAPLLIDGNRQIVAGHGRYEAAKLLALAQVPVIFLNHLTETQAIAYRLADNKLTDRSSFDDSLVAIQLKELSELALTFDIESIGFETAEMDFHIQSLDDPDAADMADEFEAPAGPAVTVRGDKWLLNGHRLICADALDSASYASLMEGQQAAATFTDPPYNVPINGHVSGNGSISHREFAMASGEMTEQEFTAFLTTSLSQICANSAPGALIYACMDWRHLGEMIAAGRSSKCDLLNVCVWVKSNPALGSLYRSQHELVFVFRNGKHPHQNNVQLGRFGRNRSNVWNWPGANGFARKGAKNPLAFHPTPKPIGMVADAILDSTKRGDIVLDPYLGSGTTILAAERTGRRCYGIEIDPIYVDTAIARWEQITGKCAVNAQGQTFAQVKLDRRTAP